MLFDDVAWLGEENAWCGPAARAAIGILIPKGDWSWWHLASTRAALNSLHSAVPRSGVAAWGGDEAVLTLPQWVEPPLAIDVAQAFRSLLHDNPWLRLRVTRSVWEWPDFRDLSGDIRADLAKALPRERIFLEWPRDQRPPRLDLDRNEGRLILTAPSPEGEDVSRYLSGTLKNVDWRRGARAADIVVATSADELASGAINADLAIVLEDDADRVIRMLDQMRAASGTRCIVRLPKGRNAGLWLRAFGSVWSGKPLDEAVAYANRATGVMGEVVAANQTFVLSSAKSLSTRLAGRPPRDVPVRDVRRDFRGIEPVESIARRIPDSAPPSRPAFPPPAARMLDATVYSNRRRVRMLPKVGTIEIAVEIRPKTPLQRSRATFPDHLVEWEGDSRTLQVHLVELERKPVTRSITVPRAGRSEAASFLYELAAKRPVDLRLMVCDGAQILQTARFQGTPGSAFDFFIEAELGSIERKKEPFDFALLVNDSLGNKPSATSLTEDGIYITTFESGDIDHIRNECRKALEPIVIHPDIDPAPVMLQLANTGGQLLEALQAEVPNWPDSFSRVQLMTKSNAFFPFEYLYDGKVPKSPNAKLCHERTDCLTAGEAKMPCALRKAAKVLCPMGFLGVTTIIERQVWDRKLDKPMWLRLPPHPAERLKLKELDRIAFAASNRADDFDDSDLPADLKLARIDDVAKELGPPVPTWDDWENAIGANNPSMLVLIAHMQNGAMWIGANDGLNLGALDTVHVGKAAVAIMIGCNSAIGTVSAVSPPAIMMRKGARVVVAALTEVLGRHSNEAALFLATQFRDASKQSTPVTIGEFVTKLRRGFLAKNIALGLVLVAFGDADLALGGDST